MKPKHTVDEFFEKGAKLFKGLPDGRTIRIEQLQKDLVMAPKTGLATIMPDEFFNVYDITGPGYSNYKP